MAGRRAALARNLHDIGIANLALLRTLDRIADMKPILRPLVVLLSLAAGVPLATAAATVPAAPAAAAAAASTRQPEDKEQLERRLTSVATLIESSSAARQIEASANPQALAARDAARALRLQAAAAFRQGRLAEASGMLDKAAQLMFSGVRLAAPEQINGAKMEGDFERRMESVKALLAAQRRISAEKGQGAKGVAASNAMEAQMRSAAALESAGQLEPARALLDQVYLTTKLSIEAMRNGDTLVRSLQFATKEEEYRYELDRNETHLMLFKLLLAEKRAANPALDATAKPYLDQAAQWRAEADARAAGKDFVAALRLLEDSTRELVRAIRSAGVYIPG
jgi:hypothetical protein